MVHQQFLINNLFCIIIEEKISLKKISLKRLVQVTNTDLGVDLEKQQIDKLYPNDNYQHYVFASPVFYSFYLRSFSSTCVADN